MDEVISCIIIITFATTQAINITAAVDSIKKPEWLKITYLVLNFLLTALMGSALINILV